jgi:hypothetical protein
MYSYNLQFEQVPSSVYTGFYNETPFYIGLSTSDPNYSDLKIKFFSQDSNSAPYQTPQNKWSHLIPQWKFLNSEQQVIEFENPQFQRTDYFPNSSDIDLEIELIFSPGVEVVGYIENAVKDFTYTMTIADATSIILPNRQGWYPIRTKTAEVDGVLRFYVNGETDQLALDIAETGLDDNSLSFSFEVQNAIETHVTQTTAYYIDDMPSTVNLIATLETSGFSFTSDHPEAKLPGYSNSLIFDSVQYEVLSASCDHLIISQDGKNPIDKFKWTDTFIPFVVTVHPNSALATNIYGLTNVDPILFSEPKTDNTSYLQLSVLSVPNSAIEWNDSNTVFLSTVDQYNLNNAGYYKGYFTSSLSSIPAKITASYYTNINKVELNNWGIGISPGFGTINGTYTKFDDNIWLDSTGFAQNAYLYRFVSGNELKWFISYTSVIPPTFSGFVTAYYYTDDVSNIYFADKSPAVIPQSSWNFGTLFLPGGFFDGDGEIGTISDLFCASAESNEFQIKQFEIPYEMRRFNESWDAGEVIQSYALAEHTYLNPLFFGDFMEVAVGGLENDYQSIGRTMFERIANFVKNHSDIDVSNVNQFYSILDSIDVPYDNYQLNYPSEMGRLVDMFSINKKRLLGDFCKCNRNFFTEIEFCEFCGHKHGLNRSKLSQTSDEFFVSAGIPFVVENVFSKNSTYRFDIVFPSVEDLSGQQTAIINTVPAVSWMTSSVYYKYSFYEYISSFCNVQEEGVINWNDPFTTLSSAISTTEQWYGDEGLIEEMLNYEIHRGIYNA